MPIIPAVRPLKSAFLNFRHQQWYNATKNQNKLVRMNLENTQESLCCFPQLECFPQESRAPFMIWCCSAIHEFEFEPSKLCLIPLNQGEKPTHWKAARETKDISSAKKISRRLGRDLLGCGSPSRFWEAWDWLQRGEMHRGLDLAQRQGMGETVVKIVLARHPSLVRLI